MKKAKNTKTTYKTAHKKKVHPCLTKVAKRIRLAMKERNLTTYSADKAFMKKYYQISRLKNISLSTLESILNEVGLEIAEIKLKKIEATEENPTTTT